MAPFQCSSFPESKIGKPWTELWLLFLTIQGHWGQMNSPKISQLAETKNKNTSPLSARQGLVHALDVPLCVRGLEKGFHLNRLVTGFLENTHTHTFGVHKYFGTLQKQEHIWLTRFCCHSRPSSSSMTDTQYSCQMWLWQRYTETQGAPCSSLGRWKEQSGSLLPWVR